MNNREAEMSAKPHARVCPKCPPGTAAFPLDIRFWSRNTRSKDGFEGWCRTCRNEATRSSRKKNSGRPNGFAQSIVPGIETPSVWTFVKDGREIRMRVDSVIPHSGLRASGLVGTRRMTVQAAWLLKNGTRVDVATERRRRRGASCIDEARARAEAGSSDIPNSSDRPAPCPDVNGVADCCGRTGEYNGFQSGTRLFECPKVCGCHD